MTWHKKSGTSASVKTPHVSVPKPTMPKPATHKHAAPKQHAPKVKANNQKTAVYAAKSMPNVGHHSTGKKK